MSKASVDYMKDAKGRFVPKTLIKPIDKTRDELVREIVKAAQDVATLMSDFKRKTFADVAAFVEMSSEEYGAKVGGDKGNITLPTFDGEFKVQIAKGDYITFDERLQAAKELVDDCINEWAQGSRPEIKALVQQAFDTDKEGSINTGRVLALRRLNIEDEKWKSAMQAIGDSVQVTGTKTYIRLYRRVASGKYEAMPMDLAGI
ncbi:DUF3164 family protein [Herbaspirillum lusitanum]|nr:DUF3164 family protein [Herbaspirillum lusitanum]